MKREIFLHDLNPEICKQQAQYLGKHVGKNLHKEQQNII